MRISEIQAYQICKEKNETPKGINLKNEEAAYPKNMRKSIRHTDGKLIFCIPPGNLYVLFMFRWDDETFNK